MSRLGDWVRNAKALLSAYLNVDTLTGDDLASEPIFASLREFASTAVAPTAIPIGLLTEFNAAQKRANGRKKFRFGAGALFATIILFPGLAYAGVLPTSVARVVQRIFNVVSVPIQIPSVTTHGASGGPSASSSTKPASTESQTPSPESAQTPSQVSTSINSEVSTQIPTTPPLPSGTVSAPGINPTKPGIGSSNTSESSDDGESGQATVSGTVGSSDGTTAPTETPQPSQTPDPTPTQSSDDSE